ncbi:MAG: M6 family metalloprotease domain-containing protein [Prevotellaceae bacterium]|nr:M6 family metalloprotease domain-containing protein [Prevotellaceae bacterium]
MFKRRFVITLAFTLAFGGAAMAVPAKRGVVRTLTMSDGTEVQATLEGDENVHFYRTTEGKCVQRVGETWEYVSEDSLHRLRSRRMETRNSARRAKAAKRQSTAYTGTRKGLVILVNFADLSFTTTQTEWDNYFNQVGYSTAGMAGSVHDYFSEQSYGKFDLSFDVVGPVTVSKKYSYYGSGDEDNAPLMIKEACQLADSQVNFADYDWDGDGYVDQVYVVYAGYNEAQGASEETIWPHEWALSGMSITLKLDGVWIDTYACSSELHGSGATGKTVVDGIGTACHEFSHCLGLPDFYDTSDTGANYGMDVWSVLDYGSYNADGYAPAAFTAYERQFCGWLDYTELSASCHVTDMPCLTDEPVAYVVYNDADADEYYLLQNIQQTGFNSKAYGHGLLIMHVDYSESDWEENIVNNTSSHQRMTLFAADNKYGRYGSNASGDPFPGTSLNTAFTDDTSPASALYNLSATGSYYMSKPIENIDETGGLLSFDFMGGAADVGVPEATAASNVNVETGTFTANWTAVSGAIRYDVCLTQSIPDGGPAANVLLAEDFENCYSSTNSASQDISASLDSYLSSSGWTGQYLYCSPYYLRIGNQLKKGYVQTPALSVESGSDVSVIVGVSFGTASSGTAEFDVETLSGAGDYVTLDQGSGYYLIYLTSWTLGDFYLSVHSISNTYLEGLYVFDGYYEWEDFDAYLAPSKINGLSSASPAHCAYVSLGETSEEDSDSSAPRLNAASTVTTIYSTTATSYTFTGLEPAVYTYKVRAVTAQGTGSWSNTVTVDLSGANAIAPVRSAQHDTGTLYDLSGRRVDTPARGIYIRDGKKYLVH